MNWKEVNKRYKRIHSRYDDDDRTKRGIHVIGGEVSEMEELLGSMNEYQEDQLAVWKLKQEKYNKREMEKYRLGSVIRDRAVGRRAGNGGSLEESQDPTENRVKKRSRRVVVENATEEVLFYEAIERSEKRRMELEEKRITLEEEKLEEECEY